MDLLYFDIETWTGNEENIQSIWGINEFLDNENKTDKIEFLIKKEDYKSYKEYIDKFNEYALRVNYLVWHNILNHDLPHLSEERFVDYKVLTSKWIIDTLWLSTLIFIEKPYHSLIKDYKLVNKSKNNPLLDAKECKKIFFQCKWAFNAIPLKEKRVLYTLLKDKLEFKAFFWYAKTEFDDLVEYSREELLDELNSVLLKYVDSTFNIEKYLNPCEDWSDMRIELAYTYRLAKLKISKRSDLSVFPAWITKNMPNISLISDDIKKHRKVDIYEKLDEYFWYKSFNNYESEDWKKISQEDIVKDAVKWKNVLAVLATWWGKSLAFQLPAFINAELWRLSIVISPLQSLMKDQIDNLNRNDIQNVWYLNWLLNPLERKEVIDKVKNWWIDLLYVSPEVLRWDTAPKMLSWRIIDRFIIDEAHCFSKWWHDFRPDYMFIKDFIIELWKENPSIRDPKTWKYKVNISCFTATAKDEVIEEIKDYFFDGLNIEFEDYVSTVKRENLKYQVMQFDDEYQKRLWLKKLIREEIIKDWKVPACIIFVRTRKKTKDLAEYINAEFWEEFWRDIATYYHWDLDTDVKRKIQDEFKNDTKNIIVATNAFWMWIDKKDVRYVIHYEIPDSLENYTQEAWRAWRDKENSQCIIFYNENDVDENFKLLRSSKISEKNVKSLFETLIRNLQKPGNWKSQLKNKIEYDDWFQVSAVELIDSKWAWWINVREEYEKRKKEENIFKSKLRTALYLLENEWFIRRWFNHTRVFATSKHVKSLAEWEEIIKNSELFKPKNLLDVSKKEKEIELVLGILKEIFNWWIVCVEDIPDKMWISKKAAQILIIKLQRLKLVQKDDDLAWFINLLAYQWLTPERQLRRVKLILSSIFNYIRKCSPQVDVPVDFNKTELNDIICEKYKQDTLVDEVSDVLNYLKNLRIWEEEVSELNESNMMSLCAEVNDEVKKFDKKNKYLRIWKNQLTLFRSLWEIENYINSLLNASIYVIEYCMSKSASERQQNSSNQIFFELSIADCIDELRINRNVVLSRERLEEVLKFLHKMWIIKIQSWLFMFWTDFYITKWYRFYPNAEWKIDLTFWDTYKRFDTFYKSKINQIHYMDRYAHLLLDDPDWAEVYLEDYFKLDDKEFRSIYFKDEENDIERPMTKTRYNRLIYKLSPEQRKVIDRKTWNELIIAWPWAGKTKTIIHKVVSLILQEWYRADEILFLTFSRSAKYELKKRLHDFLYSEANWLKIHTFHSFSYWKLWKKYNEQKDNKKIVRQAIDFIKKENIKNLPYSVIVLDEYQDINDDQFELVETIRDYSSKTDNVKVIATWDDDQNIYEFQGSNIEYIRRFKEEFDATEFILTKNYRSNQEIVDITQKFISKLPERAKWDKKLVSTRKEKWIEHIVKSISYKSDNYSAFVPDIVKEIREKMPENNWIWILCFTNEEVLKIVHYLKSEWYKGVQIALKDMGYEFNMTLECYDYFNRMSKYENITIKNIFEVYDEILAKYWENENIKNLKLALDKFLAVHEKIKYWDLVEFFSWLQEPDLLNNNKIIVSTLHQSKGREFDSVILVFDKDYKWNNNPKKDELRRLLYVWMTRAKYDLIVMWNEKFDFFKELEWYFSVRDENNNEPKTSDTVVELITSLEDVVLNNHFSFNLNSRYLEAWELFDTKDDWLYFRGSRVLTYSEKFRKRLDFYRNKWYSLGESKIFQRIVYNYMFEDWSYWLVMVYLAKIKLKK